jgi:hypothetical protein
VGVHALGHRWSEQAKLVDTSIEVPQSSAQQGSSVALSGDGNTAIVGGRFDNNPLGAAWVYTRSGGVWSQQAKLVGTDAIGSVGGPQQRFSVSLSDDGNTAIVGGPFDNNQIGVAWVFTRSTGVWSQQAKLVGTVIAPQFGALQGYSVSLSADGNTVIVGGPNDNFGEGAAWVFTRSGKAWSQQAKLIGTGFITSAHQGFSVSLSSDGNIAIVSGPADNFEIGAAWVFTRSDGM